MYLLTIFETQAVTNNNHIEFYQLMLVKQNLFHNYQQIQTRNTHI